MSEAWRESFRAFDDDWAMKRNRRRASLDGVRETYYEAGYTAAAESLEAETARLRERVAALEGERDEWHDKAVVVASAVESESRPLPSGVRIVASQVMAFHRAALAEQAGGVR